MVSVEQFTRRRPYNAASEFVDANVNRGLGSKIAFADGKRTLTYQQLQDDSVRFAHGLLSTRPAPGKPDRTLDAGYRRLPRRVLGMRSAPASSASR